MKSISVAALFASLSVTQLHASTCADPQDVIGVTLRSATFAGEIQSLSILRATDSRVIYEFEPQGVSRIYLRYSADLIGYEEYFHAENIGVEHEPSKENVPGGWSEVNNFVSDSHLSLLREVGAGIYRCLATTSYEGVIEGESLQVVMIDELSLPVTITRRTAAGDVVWEIESLVTNRARISSVSTQVAAYKTFDFADLGDHEDEPFFRNSGYLQYKLGHDHSHDPDH